MQLLTAVLSWSLPVAVFVHGSITAVPLANACVTTFSDVVTFNRLVVGSFV